jgi:hypothetical protein
MMGISRADAMQMPLYEYEARLYHWNESHDTSRDVEAPDPAIAMPLLDRINADPRLTH